jgi:hypothetical protein
MDRDRYETEHRRDTWTGTGMRQNTEETQGQGQV